MVLAGSGALSKHGKMQAPIECRVQVSGFRVRGNQVSRSRIMLDPL